MFSKSFIVAMEKEQKNIGSITGWLKIVKVLNFPYEK